MENPAPMIEAELIVTDDVPVEVSVSDSVVAVFTGTFPKLRLLALTVNWGLWCLGLPPPEPLFCAALCPTGKLPPSLEKPTPVMEQSITTPKQAAIAA